MAGESIAQLIVFIGAIVIAVGVIYAVTSNVQSITASYGMNSKTEADQLRSDITIINDPEIIPRTASGMITVYNYSFFVKNTGISTLDNSSVNMLVDGIYVNVTNQMTIMKGGSMWYPTYVLRMNYSTKTQLSSGDHVVRVVAGNGVSDTMAFKIL